MITVSVSIYKVYFKIIIAVIFLTWKSGADEFFWNDVIIVQGLILRTWINFNPSMEK